MSDYYGALAEFEAGFGDAPTLPPAMLIYRRHKLFGNLNNGGYHSQPIVWLYIIEAVDEQVRMWEMLRERQRASENTGSGGTQSGIA